MQSMKGRLTKGATWLAATRAFINLTAFANTLLLAHFLVPADFGLVAIATTVTTIITSITELSLASALVYHADPQDEHFHSAFTLNLARSALIAALILSLAYPVSRFYHDERLVGIMAIISGTTLLSGMMNPKLVIFSRNLIFWQEFAIGVSQKVLGVIAAAVVAIAYHSYWALVASTIATQVSALILSYALLPYRPRLRFGEVRELLSFSIWLSLGQAVNTLNWKFDHLVIGYFLGSSSLGYYTVGDNLAVLPTREATTPLAQTLFPGFARVADDLERLRQAYQRAQSFLCAIALPAGCGFAVIAKPLILLTMGTKWLPAVIIIQLLSGIMAFQTLGSTLQPLAMALGETRSLFYRDILNFLIRLPLIILGFLYGGLIGIVWARCISGVASTLINMAMVTRLLNLPLRRQFAVNSRGLVSVAAMVAGSYVVGQLNNGSTSPQFLIFKIVMMIGSGALIYLTAIYVLWRAFGRPLGPESEVAEIISKLLLLAHRRQFHAPNSPNSKV